MEALAIASRRESGLQPPWTVLVLLLLLVAAYGLELWVGRGDAGALASLLDRWGLVPRELRRPGAPLSVWWTPLTSMFLHGSALHLASNAVFLWWFGVEVEARIGGLRFAGLYLASGLVAAACHVLSAPDAFAPALGASGAVAGVVGAWLLLWRDGGWGGSGWAVLALWGVLQVAAGLFGATGVAWWAHVGGLATGLLLLPRLRPDPT